MKREAAVGVTLLLIATLFSGCLGSAGGNYGRSVRVEGITQKYHFADHSGINVHLSGRQTTDTMSHRLLSRMNPVTGASVQFLQARILCL